MTRVSGAKAALAAILLAIALGFGGALTNLQPADALADAAPSASVTDAAPNASAALTAANPGGPGAAPAGASDRVALPPTQPNPSSGAAQTTVDYDDDDDGLIDVKTLAQLNAVRHDLNGNGDATHADYIAAFPNRITAAGTRMGCPSGTCTGYELRADLDFDTDGDGDVDSSDSPSYANWVPIGSATTQYTAEFKGNNRTISNLTITSQTNALIGLISSLSSSGTISGVGMRDANLTISAAPNNSRVGALVGYNEGTVRSSYSTGTLSITVVGGSAYVGGLVGMIVQGGKVEASWSSADVSGSGPSQRVGGLVGQLGFQNHHGHVTACYATGDVSASGTGSGRAGGLVGWTLTGGSRITASYSTGAATASGTNAAANPLTGSGHTLSIVTSNSYWDTETSGIADDADSDSPEGETSANLKAPTGYSGIYANWNVNVDGAAGNDDPWDFGTSSHYPRLKFSGMDLAAQLRDYDLDDDGLAEIYNLDQLNAVRWDLDGSGAHDSGVSAANQKKYKSAFFNADESLGCPDTADADTDPGPCTGYELMNDLNFDTDGSGAVDSSDDYPNFPPIGSYGAEFKGNNNTISNLTMSVTSASIYSAGLFGNVSGTGTITGVGLADADVSHAATGGTNIRTGALVGSLSGTVRSSWSTGSVSNSSARPYNYVGGLVGGVSNGTVAASWSSADVSASAGTTESNVGGLVGFLDNYTATATATIIASYASGSASNTATAGTRRAGGLVGIISSASGGNYAVTASYTTATVSSTGTANAIIGAITSSSTGSVTASYWDVSKTGIEDDTNTSAPEGKTSSELTTPTAYGTQSTDIYMGWNVNVDGSAGADDPWDFGDATQYPRLKFDGMDLSIQNIAPVIDYDTDDDNLIDITTLAQLNAVRWDLDGDGDPVSANAADYAAAFPNRDISASGRMGCIDASSPTDNTADCGGYELMNDLDFDTDDSGTIDSSDDYPNWTPIGGSTAYSGEFKGNNRTISDLTMSATTIYAGLFGHASGTITGVGLPDAAVTQAATSGTNARAGALVGLLTGGTVRASWATGSVSSSSSVTNTHVGGLVGGVANGTVAASWADVAASVSAGTTASNVGGLVGALENSSASTTATIIASYAAGSAANTATAGTRSAGGLVGYISATTGNYAVTASYAGALTSSAQPANAGPFNGSVASSSTGTITASYWDISKTGAQDDADNDAPEGKTAADLTAPTAYGTQATDIYMSWNVDVDGDTNSDDPWDFGDTNQYPKLKFDGMSLSAQTIAPPTDYDSDDDNLIDVRTLGQLNAIRYDLNGDGNIGSPSDTAAYEAAGAYPNRAIGMGCPATCNGYELMNDLDFDTDGSGVVDASDSPSFPNWEPIATDTNKYTAEFKGNNRTISNLTITTHQSHWRLGLFDTLSPTAVVTGVGMVDANINVPALRSSSHAGALAGYNEGTIRSSYSTGSVSAAVPAPGAVQLGGLVGTVDAGTIAASWSSVDVSATGRSARVGGLVGQLGFGSNGGAIIASYASGSVAATGGASSSVAAGGLIGDTLINTSVTASYAAGPVSASGTNTEVGGLIDELPPPAGVTVSSSYWDTDLTGVADDSDSDMPEGRTARQIQQPRPYSGIYRDWNVDIDNADADGDLTTGRDDPWEFGTGMQYPMLKYGGMSLPAQGSLAMGAPDVDTNGETPTVGRMARVCLTTGPVLRAPRTGNPSLPARWVWQRSADLLTWTDIAEDGGGTYEYTPVAADVNNYLRACVAIRSSDARSRGESEMCTRPFPAAQGN